VIQFTVQRFGRVHKRPGLTDGFRIMAKSLSDKEHKASPRRWLITSLLIYGTMVVGLLGYFAVFPDSMTPSQHAEATRTQTLSKPARYEAVIANWNRYRNKDARADAR